MYVVNTTKSVLRLNLLLFFFCVCFNIEHMHPLDNNVGDMRFHEYMPLLWLKSGEASSLEHISSIFNSTLFCVNFTFHWLEGDLAAFKSITVDLSLLPSLNLTPGRMNHSGLTLEPFLVT